MVNFRDPAVFDQDLLAIDKFCHTLDGLYIWEFLTTLDYEWRMIRGRQPYRWTIWLYFLARFATLMTVIINLVTLNLTTQTNCQVWVTFSFTFSYIANASSSLLILLRVIAIWNWNKCILISASMAWGANVAFLILGITRVRSSWHPVNLCSIPNAKSNTATFISMFCTDFILLVIMLGGLLRLRHRGTGTFALGRLLWKQGVIWLLLATATELPPVVFVCLDLNEAFNLMFSMPVLVTMSIAATRMYRSLADFLGSTDVYAIFFLRFITTLNSCGRSCHVTVTGGSVDSGNTPRTDPTVPNSKSTISTPAPPRRVEVAVHTAHEKNPSSLTDENTLYIGEIIHDSCSATNQLA